VSLGMSLSLSLKRARTSGGLTRDYTSSGEPGCGATAADAPPIPAAFCSGERVRSPRSWFCTFAEPLMRQSRQRAPARAFGAPEAFLQLAVHTAQCTINNAITGSSLGYLTPAAFKANDLSAGDGRGAHAGDAGSR
jgi:hypothetical protein